MNTFTYLYPVKIYFGKGCADGAIKAELAKVGKHVLFAFGGGSVKKTGLYERIHTLLKDAGKTVTDFGGIMPNPTYAKVQEGACLVREHKIDFILAVGGGSVIDACKIVSAQSLLPDGMDIWEYEYSERKLPTEFVPMGAVVTASGTGAENNNGAVITHEEKKLKAPLWGAFADFAVLDVDVTATVPFKQTVSGAFDTLSHAMETYFGTTGEAQLTNLSDEISESVMRSTIRNIRVLLSHPDSSDPENETARSELMWASAMAENGILKIGKTTDFQCHMIEHQLGAYTDCNHGMGLSAIHPALYRHMMPEANPQFARMAVEVWGVDPAGKTEAVLAEAFVDSLAAFIKEIGMPSTLGEMGITDENILRAVADTSVLTPGCCKKLSREEIFELLKESM